MKKKKSKKSYHNSVYTQQGRHDTRWFIYFLQLASLLLAILGQSQHTLLHTTRQQRAIRRIHLLQDKASSITRPRALHLDKHPLIGLDAPRLMEVDAVIQADNHAHLRPALPFVQRRPHALKLGQLHHMLARLLGQPVHVLRLERESPELMHARHRTDEIAVRHVRQRLQMRLVARPGGHLAARADPLACLALVGARRLVVQPRHLHAVALQRAVARPVGLAVPVDWGRLDAVGERRGVVHLALAGAAFAHKADGCGEDAAALLLGLDGARGKGAAVAHALDVEEDRDGVGAREEEVAMA